MLSNALLAPVVVVGLRNVPSAIFRCFRGRSGEDASSGKVCGAVQRADLPYVTTFLRRSGMVNEEDMGKAMLGTMVSKRVYARIVVGLC